MSSARRFQPAGQPANESARLAALHRLDMLDTEPEPIFDDLVVLAAQLCNAPISLLALIDAERQWFKARIGIDLIESPREESFCAHAILSDESIFEIPDALQDERFADNPLVTGAPHIRFYAGAVLVGSDGARYGALSVMDHQPRRLDATQRELLLRLARQAAAHLQVNIDRKAAQAGTEARANLQGIIDASLDVAIIVTDATGLVTLFNPGAERLLGYSAEEVVGKVRPSEVFHEPAELEQRAHEVGMSPFDQRAVAAIAATSITERGVDTRLWTYLRKDGASRQVRLSVSMLQDAEGERYGYVGMATDITPLAEAEEAARLSNDRFRSAFVASAQGMALMALDGQLSEVNQSLCDMLGYTPDELRNASFELLTLPEDVSADWERIRQLASGEVSSLRFSRRFLRKDGQIAWAIVTVSVVRDRSGQPLHLVAQVLDVSQQKRANDALVENRQFLQALFEHAADALVVLDANGRITQANQAARLLMGLNLGDKLVLTGDQVPPLSELLQNSDGAAETDSARRLQADVAVRGQPAVPVEVSISRVPQAGIPHWVAIIRDLSEQREMERLKQEFVSTVSHELRTPLTAVAGALSLVTSGALGAVPDELKEMLDIAELNGRRLMRLVNDLLDMDKLIAGKMHFAIEPIDLEQAVDESLAAIAAYAEPYAVTLQAEAHKPLTALGDPLRFTQVMNNLLSNACKHSPAGGVVTVSCRRDGSDIVIAVRDQGAGVPAAFHPRVFEKFSQADAANDRTRVGTGLGLAIAKELVEGMGGVIGFESREGEGACFWFRLPAARQSTGGPRTGEAA